MALEDADGFFRRDRVGNVMEVDARHELLRRHVRQQFPDRLLLGLGVKIPHRIHNRGERQVHGAFLGAKPAELRVAGKAVPEGRKVAGDVGEAAAHDEVTKRFDGGDAHFVAAADRKRETVALEAAIGFKDHVRR
jgi:hypothetical protein